LNLVAASDERLGLGGAFILAGALDRKVDQVDSGRRGDGELVAAGGIEDTVVGIADDNAVSVFAVQREVLLASISTGKK